MGKYLGVGFTQYRERSRHLIEGHIRQFQRISRALPSEKVVKYIVCDPRQAFQMPIPFRTKEFKIESKQGISRITPLTPL